MTEKMKDYHKQVESSNKYKQTKKTDVQDVVIPLTYKVLDALPVDINANTARKLDISVICASRSHKNKHTRKGKLIPQAHQLQVGRYSSVDHQCDQEDTSKSDDSFCLQMQIKLEQADQERCEAQQLLTHLEYKLKYHREEY